MQNVQPCSKSSSCKTEMNRLRHSLSFTARSGRALKESPEVAVHEHQQKPSKPHMGAKVRTRRSWSIRSGLLPFKCKARNEVGAMHGSLRESQRGFGLPASGSSRSSDASANAPSQRKSAPREQESLAWYPRGVCSKEEAECEAAMPREGDRRMQRSSSFAIAQLSVTEQRHAEQAPQPTVDGSGGQSDSTRSECVRPLWQSTFTSPPRVHRLTFASHHFCTASDVHQSTGSPLRAWRTILPPCLL